MIVSLSTPPLWQENSSCFTLLQTFYTTNIYDFGYSSACEWQLLVILIHLSLTAHDANPWLAICLSNVCSSLLLMFSLGCSSFIIASQKFCKYFILSFIYIYCRYLLPFFLMLIHFLNNVSSWKEMSGFDKFLFSFFPLWFTLFVPLMS